VAYRMGGRSVIAMQPAVDDEAEVGELAGGLDDGRDLVAERGRKDEKAVLLGGDGDEVVWFAV